MISSSTAENCVHVEVLVLECHVMICICFVYWMKKCRGHHVDSEFRCTSKNFERGGGVTKTNFWENTGFRNKGVELWVFEDTVRYLVWQYWQLSPLSVPGMAILAIVPTYGTWYGNTGNCPHLRYLVWQYWQLSPLSQLTGSPHSSAVLTLGQGVDLYLNFFGLRRRSLLLWNWGQAYPCLNTHRSQQLASTSVADPDPSGSVCFWASRIRIH
jgi:hypothetical protein